MGKSIIRTNAERESSRNVLSNFRIRKGKIT